MQVERGGKRIAKTDNPIFGSVNIPSPQRSGFDLSYNNRYTSHFLQLIPCFAEEILPSDTMSYGVAQHIEFAPLVNPIFDAVDSCYEAFFVPYRLLDPLWREFITGKSDKNNVAVPTVPLTVGPSPNEACNVEPTQYGSLLDYFGYGTPCSVAISSNAGSADVRSVIRCSAYPILAYWRIIADWYQIHDIENISKNASYAPMLTYENGLPTTWATGLVAWTGRNLNATSTSDATYAKAWFPFLRRPARDFLSTATLAPQSGSAVSVNTASGSFTIESFRVASALQRFAERSNLAGTRYNEDIMAHFGIEPSDSACDRAEYLGSTRFAVASNAVTQTSESSSTSVLGQKGAQMNSNGATMLFNDRTFTEHGIVICLQSLDAPNCYIGRRDRRLQKVDRMSWAFPELANLGDEPIYNRDAMNVPVAQVVDYDSWVTSAGKVFGYNERYFDWKSNPDEVHGEFANTSNDLAKMTLAKYAVSLPNHDVRNYVATYNTMTGYSYIENRIFASTGSLSNVPPVWVSVRNICHMTRPLPEHNTPMV